ncbi:hypothetical protein D0C36_20860 [Mucilaginibacter conchicola]|uniref:Outer membrane protein beta-barrel domain-containing protein n=1 Tax=Mucilaginibacter conchicola TaxID=2303333 RepID=A0A372NMS1_9SPHI|nr:hypothetical protein [Mucilaginibacter conchicola]RFZ90251.1 hypothetical protein D0C36_20860 [Mucilaginibacter conchicola]
MKKDLFEHIKNELTTYEAGYREGAWEEFVSAKKRRGTASYRRLAAAALLIFVLGVLYKMYHAEKGDPREEVVAVQKFVAPVLQTDRNSSPGHGEQDAANKTRNVGISGHVSGKGHRRAADLGKPAMVFPESIHRPEVVGEINIRHAGLRDSSFETSGYMAQNILSRDDSRKNTSPSAGKRWSFSFGAGSGLDNRGKSNGTAGIDINYALSERVSLGSGIYYLGAGSEIRSSMMPTAADPEKRLTRGVADLRGLNIPLRLNYRLTSNVYAHAGVSVLPVINQNRTLEFTESKSVVNTFVDENGREHTETINIQEVTEAVLTNQELKKDRFVAFYDLSIGLQVFRYKQHPVIIEPFVKVPVTRYADQRFNLLQSGLQVKIGF